MIPGTIAGMSEAGLSPPGPIAHMPPLHTSIPHIRNMAVPHMPLSPAHHLPLSRDVIMASLGETRPLKSNSSFSAFSQTTKPFSPSWLFNKSVLPSPDASSSRMLSKTPLHSPSLVNASRSKLNAMKSPKLVGSPERTLPSLPSTDEASSLPLPSSSGTSQRAVKAIAALADIEYTRRTTAGIQQLVSARSYFFFPIDIMQLPFSCSIISYSLHHRGTPFRLLLIIILYICVYLCFSLQRKSLDDAGKFDIPDEYDFRKRISKKKKSSPPGHFSSLTSRSSDEGEKVEAAHVVVKAENASFNGKRKTDDATFGKESNGEAQGGSDPLEDSAATSKRSRDDGANGQPSKKKRKRQMVTIGQGGVEFDLSAEGRKYDDKFFTVTEEEEAKLETQPGAVRFAMLMTCEIARSSEEAIENCPRFYMIIWSLFATLSKNTSKLDFVLLLMQVGGAQVQSVFPAITSADEIEEFEPDTDSQQLDNLSLTAALPPVIISSLIDPGDGGTTSVSGDSDTHEVDSLPAACMRIRNTCSGKDNNTNMTVATNNAFLELFGYTKEDVVDINRNSSFLPQVVIEEDWPIVVKELVSAWCSRPWQTRMGVRVRTKAGKIIPVMFVLYRQWDKKMLCQMHAAVIPFPKGSAV